MRPRLHSEDAVFLSRFVENYATDRIMIQYISYLYDALIQYREEYAVANIKESLTIQNMKLVQQTAVVTPTYGVDWTAKRFRYRVRAYARSRLQWTAWVYAKTAHDAKQRAAQGTRAPRGYNASDMRYLARLSPER